MTLCHHGALLILETQFLPELANMQTNQSRVHSPNHLFYLTLTHQANIPPTLNHSRARKQTTRDYPYSPEYSEIIQTKPILNLLTQISYAQLCLPPETMIKSLAYAFPSVFLPPDAGASMSSLSGMAPPLGNRK